MEPIEGIENVQKERWELTCCVCKQRMGAKVQCAVCYSAFHPLCGRMAGLHMEMKEAVDGSGRMNFVAHCPKHFPPRPELSGVQPYKEETGEGSENQLWNAQPFRPPGSIAVPEPSAGCARAQDIAEGQQRIFHGTGAGCTSMCGFWIPTPDAADIKAHAASTAPKGLKGKHKGRKSSTSGGLGLAPYARRGPGRQPNLSRAAPATGGEAPSGPPPRAELVPPPDGMPESCLVCCNGRVGEMHLRTQRVVHEGQEMSASKFEALCGRGDAKKWKMSLW
jgi:hypothetical protein